uniref:BMA-RIG-5, isoform e n=1 Tax=Brugia malayi TaxID=6279 RepID=A0A1I9G4Z8_BRUMA|nr:BMA-RIG-5, isoform e [Brugia malayi]
MQINNYSYYNVKKFKHCSFLATVFNGSDMTIIKVSRKHMSEYICVASNGVPPDESWTVKLHVTFEPTVVPQAEIVQVALGNQISLVCNVEAWPKPLVKWGKNGQEIFNSSTFSFVLSGRYCSIHILTIKNISKNEFGTYRCIAINDNGEHFADIIVKAQHTINLQQCLLRVCLFYDVENFKKLYKIYISFIVLNYYLLTNSRENRDNLWKFYYFRFY